MPRVVMSFTATTLSGFVAPAGVTSVQLMGYGGGGAGGDGYGGWSYSNYLVVGGAGGGGALQVVAEVPVVPGTAYNIIIGAGGAAGGSGFWPKPLGENGGDTIFARKLDGATLATFRGAEGGTGAFSFGKYPDVERNVGVLGGGPVPGDRLGWAASTGGLLPARMFPGVGGYGTTPDAHATYGRLGAASVQGFQGGAAGVHGTNDGIYFGGGGGGGGAAGPGGNGGNGGAGGAARATSPAQEGSPGNGALVVSGAGGGGGGTGGANPNQRTGYGPGGAGGSGRLTIMYVV